jgi:hypothetical protein
MFDAGIALHGVTRRCFKSVRLKLEVIDGLRICLDCWTGASMPVVPQRSLRLAASAGLQHSRSNSRAMLFKLKADGHSAKKVSGAVRRALGAADRDQERPSAVRQTDRQRYVEA